MESSDTPPVDAATLARASAEVALRDLTIRVGQRTLLDRSSAEFSPGTITLVVGRSGVGKSLLLRTLCGLLDELRGTVEVTGEVCIAGSDLLAAQAGSPSVGIVFQSYALFDEFTPLENMRFAADHRRSAERSSSGSAQRDAEVEALLTELELPAEARTATLSGGQKQRLAIARALAFEPDVMLYDEPTSNLDAVTADRVAQLIAATHRQHRQTSIIVTHDNRSLLPIADRVYLFDPRQKALIEIARAQWPHLAELMQSTVPMPASEAVSPYQTSEPQETAISREVAEPRDSAAVPDSPGLLGRLGRAVAAVLESASCAAEQAVRLPQALVPRWRSVAWGVRFLVHYLRLVADPSAWLYVAVAGGITGFVATYFTFRFFPFRTITEPLVIEDLLQALGFVLYRVVVPLLVSVLVAARCGAAVTADIGIKAYSRQIDALRTFGAAPQAYLLSNIIWAFLLGTWVLNTIAFFAARLASLLVFTVTHAEFGPFFWESQFFAMLRVPGSWSYEGAHWLTAKLLVCAAGMAMIAYRQGVSPKYSAVDVSRSVTSTVLWSTLYVLMVHMGFALFEFE